MDVLSILFMSFVVLMVLISTVVIVREIIKDNGSGKRTYINKEELRAIIRDIIAEERQSIEAELKEKEDKSVKDEE